MQEVPVAEEMEVFEGRLQEIPFPTAKVVHAAAVAQGLIGRARTGGTPLLGAVLAKCDVPCYFRISSPWRKAEAGVKINA